MAIKVIKAIVKGDKHIETKQVIQDVKSGQEIEIFIRLTEELSRKDKAFSFSDHDFGKWYGSRMRREEMYHQDGR